MLFSALSPRTSVCDALSCSCPCVVCAHRMLIGACTPMVCPIHVFRPEAATMIFQGGWSVNDLGILALGLIQGATPNRTTLRTTHSYTHRTTHRITHPACCVYLGVHVCRELIDALQSNGVPVAPLQARRRTGWRSRRRCARPRSGCTATEAIMFGPFPTSLSALYHPTRAVCHCSTSRPCLSDADWGL